MCNAALIGIFAFSAPCAANAETVTIAALGDSLTAGYGLPPEEGLVPQLEAIVHPLVSAAIRAQGEQAQAEGRRCLVIDIPLLVEGGRERHSLDHVLVVDCLPETQVQRVMTRSGLNEAEVRSIIAAQAPREVRLAAADSVIFNQDLSLAQLEAEVRRVAAGFGL